MDARKNGPSWALRARPIEPLMYISYLQQALCESMLATPMYNTGLGHTFTTPKLWRLSQTMDYIGATRIPWTLLLSN
jgi:hypothetical protein